jgi:hypothetical protein
LVSLLELFDELLYEPFIKISFLVGYDFQSVYLSIFGFQFTLELKSPQFPFTGKPKAYKPQGFGGSAPFFTVNP